MLNWYQPQQELVSANDQPGTLDCKLWMYIMLLLRKHGVQEHSLYDRAPRKVHIRDCGMAQGEAGMIVTTSGCASRRSVARFASLRLMLGTWLYACSSRSHEAVQRVCVSASSAAVA